MNEPETKDNQGDTEISAHPALPAREPSHAPFASSPSEGVFEAGLVWIERRPVVSGLVAFVFLSAIHLLILNLTGVANGLFIGENLLLAEGSASVEIILLGFIAYNIVLPTLFARACAEAYDGLRHSLIFDDRLCAKTRAGLLDPFYATRLAAGLLWAVLLTPVFGSLLRVAIPGDGSSAALLTIWMYIRIALTFGLLGASIAFIVMLHHRFRAVTANHLRIDLFDPAALRPIAIYARRVALFLFTLLALAGPAAAQPQAMYPSAAVLAFGVLLSIGAACSAIWGARRAIRAEKGAALTELQAYTREIWRRAYVNNHIAEAVAIPALGAMLTVRNEIARLPDWPGGWGLLAKLTPLTLIPIASWFGGQIAASMLDTITR